jgi:DNA-binding CsgD family transcriptional regulator
LAKANVPHLYIAEEVARHHHERFDGTGYPARLKGTMIPLAARITALAEVFDTLTHARPYKGASSVKAALSEIAAQRGTQFDPELTDLLLALIPRLQRQHGNLDEFLGQEAQSSPFLRARRQLTVALDATLSARELAVAQVLARGATNKQIASQLQISEYTVRDHVSSLLRKCGVKTRAELVAGIAAGMIAGRRLFIGATPHT